MVWSSTVRAFRSSAKGSGRPLDTVDDAKTGVELVDSVPDAVTRVTADGMYNTVAFYEATDARGATVVVPPTKIARVSKGRGTAIGPAVDGDHDQARGHVEIDSGVARGSDRRRRRLPVDGHLVHRYRPFL